MTTRTATLQGVSASRGPARGLLVAGNQKLAGAESLTVRAEKVAAVAAAHAAAVDSGSRFPAEAMAAAREQRLLGVAVPREFGGEGASISEIADICYALGRACASTAMVYAMHQTKVACLTRHGRSSPWHQLLMRRICAEQMLLASSTTEGDRGGDIRNSTAPIERQGARIALERSATVISYGEAADAIVTTARRSADAASADQVLVVLLKQDYTLEASGRLGCARHARHMQRWLQAHCICGKRADPARGLRRNSCPHHDAGCASAVEQRLGRHCRSGR